jgi:hypothetical protein
MCEPFESSFSKIAWAEKRLADFYWEIVEFGRGNPYGEVDEPHPDKPRHVVRKIKLTRDIPESTLNLASELIHGLRSSLDNAVFDIALATGTRDPRSAAFPFAKDISEMANALGRCKNVPPPIQSFLCGLQPYQGGNDFLWALNKLSNIDKHRILRPFGTGVFRSYGFAQGVGYFSVPDPHRWDSAKSEMEIITLGPGAIFNYRFDFQLFIAFGEVEGLAGQDAAGKMTAMCATVFRAVTALQAECNRLGFVK